MMMNLFSSFNPMSTSSVSLGWMMLIIPMMTTWPPFWKIKSPINTLTSFLINLVSQQLKMSTKKSMIPILNPLMMLTMMIMTMNMLGLLPNVFPVTAQIMINLSLSLPLWGSSILSKMKKMMILLAHMNPPSTPMTLTPLMVMIETTSLFIQPLTLAIRLTANVTAGHILMTLITTAYLKTSIQMESMTMMIHLLLCMLEMAMSLIQSYVFSMLITMYMNN